METDIRQTLFDWIDRFAAARDLTVAYPNRPFDASTQAPAADGGRDGDRRYLRASVLPARPDVRGVTNGWSVHTWLFQVSVYVRDGVGDIAAQRLADELRISLPFATRLAGADRDYTVMGPADIAAPVSLDGWQATPVTFRLQAIA